MHSPTKAWASMHKANIHPRWNRSAAWPAGTVNSSAGGKAQVAAAGMVFPLLLIVMPVLFASFYASVRDVFGPQGAP